MKVRVVGFVPSKDEIMYSGYGQTEIGVNDKQKEPDGSVV